MTVQHKDNGAPERRAFFSTVDRPDIWCILLYVATIYIHEAPHNVGVTSDLLDLHTPFEQSQQSFTRQRMYARRLNGRRCSPEAHSPVLLSVGIYMWNQVKNFDVHAEVTSQKADHSRD